jgi:hypothetical protein
MAKELVASIGALHRACLIPGLPYKTAFGRELLTSIFPGNEAHRGGLTSQVWAHPWPAPLPAAVRACRER